jgi:hypothetical protein
MIFNKLKNKAAKERKGERYIQTSQGSMDYLIKISKTHSKYMCFGEKYQINVLST